MESGKGSTTSLLTRQASAPELWEPLGMKKESQRFGSRTPGLQVSPPFSRAGRHKVPQAQVGKVTMPPFFNGKIGVAQLHRFNRRLRSCSKLTEPGDGGNGD